MVGLNPLNRVVHLSGSEARTRFRQLDTYIIYYMSSGIFSTCSICHLPFAIRNICHLHRANVTDSYLKCFRRQLSWMATFAYGKTAVRMANAALHSAYNKCCIWQLLHMASTAYGKCCMWQLLHMATAAICMCNRCNVAYGKICIWQKICLAICAVALQQHNMANVATCIFR